VAGRGAWLDLCPFRPCRPDTAARGRRVCVADVNTVQFYRVGAFRPSLGRTTSVVDGHRGNDSV